MTFDDYTKQALSTLVSTGDEFKDLMHFVSGLTAETGEVAGKFQKIIRDKNGVLSDEDKIEIAKELGDVLWYLTVLADAVGAPISSVADKNIAKLQSRQQRNLISGSGDNR